MLRKDRTSARLFSGFDTLQFASVMGLVVFVVLIIFMTVPTAHHGLSVDLPQVLRPAAMPGAGREDALKVAITRDGSIYFGNDRIYHGDLSAKIQDRLKDRDVERKVYVVADARAHWGAVENALDGVRAAGIVRVAIMAEKRRVPSFTR